MGVDEEKLRNGGYLEGERKNFMDPKPFDTVLASDLLLVNMRGLRQDPVLQIYDQEYPNARLKYFTPLLTALCYDTIGEYCDHNAMLKLWAAYCALAVVHIPKGSRVSGLIGLAASQKADKKMLKRDAESLEIDPSVLQHSVPGGGVQLLITKASNATVFDFGSVFKELRFISRLGKDFTDPYLDPRKHFPAAYKLKHVRFHGVCKRLDPRSLYVRGFLGLCRWIR